MSHPFRFRAPVVFRDDRGFFDDGTAPQEFYEEYVQKHPSLHAEDAGDKAGAVIHCLEEPLLGCGHALDSGCGVWFVSCLGGCSGACLRTFGHLGLGAWR